VSTDRSTPFTQFQQEIMMSIILSRPAGKEIVFDQDGPPSPIRFFESMNAHQRSAALKAAIELELFTAIRETSGTVPEIAARINASKRGVRALCDFLVVLGFLGKYIEGAESSYSLTTESAIFLDKGSPQYVGCAAVFLGSDYLTEGFKNFSDVVRAGGPLSDQRHASQELPLWVDFARSMAPMLFPVAELTAGLIQLPPKPRVLDIAASHGLFGIMVAKRHPEATITAVDFPSVLTVARESAERFGVLDRYISLAGDALEVPLGSNFDVAIVSNLIHHWDREIIHKMLTRLHEALRPGGQVVLIEFVPNEDRVSPPIPAWFVMNMLANTPGGDNYTLAEHTDMLERAGFSSVSSHPLTPTAETAIVAMKI
jgi:ubiquinone/menaquinone biosynthesis C-methylase UbiE